MQKQIRYEASMVNFNNIPGNLFVYWVGKSIFDIYKNYIPLNSICDPKQGIAASGNDLFLRHWYEVNFLKACFINDENFDYIQSTKKYKWFQYSKGGEFRKWYGNEEYLINYANNGYDINHHKGAVVRNPSYYFKESISWSDISSNKISFKYKTFGHIFDAAGPSIFFENKDDMQFCLGLLNTVIIEKIAKFMSPALHFSVGQVAVYPFKNCDKLKKDIVILYIQENIKLSKNDWDSFETSWNFKKHPLI